MVNFVGFFCPPDGEPSGSVQKDAEALLGKPRRGMRAKPGHECPGDRIGEPINLSTPKVQMFCPIYLPLKIPARV